MKTKEKEQIAAQIFFKAKGKLAREPNMEASKRKEIFDSLSSIEKDLSKRNLADKVQNEINKGE